MTVDERAEDVMIRLQRTSNETRQEGIIRRAITEAIEEDRASRECCKAKFAETRDACAKIAAKYFDSGEIVDEIRALAE